MNDFTKEELKIILLEMNISINRHRDLLKVAPSYQALKDKIESMIDDYCEHDLYDFFLPKVGAILTEEKTTELDKLKLIKQSYLETVFPEKFKNRR